MANDGHLVTAVRDRNRSIEDLRAVLAGRFLHRGCWLIWTPVR
jgi:hypothetical protein